MVDRPEWLSNEPVDIDVDSLAAFADVIQAELDQNVKPGVTAILNRLTGESGVTGERTFGVDTRYQQAVIIGNYHSECEIRGRKLLEDFQQGMATIASGAHAIAGAYFVVDVLNQIDISKIFDRHQVGSEPLADSWVGDPVANEGYVYPPAGPDLRNGDHE